MEKQRNNYKIGLYLDQALHQKIISTAKLSEMTGIDRDLIQKYLINRYSPSYSTIEVIAKALELPVDYFIHDTFDNPWQTCDENENEYELRAHIANTDLLINLKKDEQRSRQLAFKSLQKLNNQIFNTLTDEGQIQMIFAIWQNLINECYRIEHEEKNGDLYVWKDLFESNTLDVDNLRRKKTKEYLKNIINKCIDELINGDIE